MRIPGVGAAAGANPARRSLGGLGRPAADSGGGENLPRQAWVCWVSVPSKALTAIYSPQDGRHTCDVLGANEGAFPSEMWPPGARGLEWPPSGPDSI